MKKLLCILMFGMMFGSNVSQRVITYNGDENGFLNLETLFPEYDLDWAILNLIDCGEGECEIGVVDVAGYSTHSLWRSTDSHFYPWGNYTSSFFADKNANFIVDADSLAGVKFLVTAEFPQEDTGYIEDGFDYCLHTGANLKSSPCRDDVAIEDAIPSEILQDITGIITEGAAASNIDGNWVGSLQDLNGERGYWIISDIDGCFNYTCSEEN